MPTFVLVPSIRSRYIIITFGFQNCISEIRNNFL